MIEDKFKELGLTPRERQVDIINDILVEYLDKKREHVVLSASTGIGKSLIAFVVSEILYKLTNQEMKNDLKPSFIVAHTNTLLNQYEDSYSDKVDMILVKGVTNYICNALTTKYEEITAEECIYSNKLYLPSNVTQACSECEYLKVRAIMNQKNHFVTNYAFFYSMKLYNATLLKPRLITIWDEAHLKCDTFVNFMKIEIKDTILEKNAEECEKEGLIKESESLLAFKDNIIEKRFTEDNYLRELEVLFNIYADIEEEFKDEAHKERTDNNFAGYKYFNKKARKYGYKKQNILNLLEYEYEHVLDIQEKEVIISPIFMRGMFHEVNHSQYNLFMSATIDKDYIATTLNVDSVGFVDGGCIFDPENKKIIDCQMEGFNYKKMQNPEFMNNIGDVVVDIVHDYSDCKGIINVTSFPQLKFVKEYLNNYLIQRGLDVTIYAQNQEEGLTQVLEKFKEDKSPSVLISPSIFEGIDLPDDECRYIIFLKAPYLSLSDKRISYILTKHPVIYEKMAVYRMVQGIGRAVRNENDYCDTYFLDGNLNRLFFSKYNLWKREFKRYVRKD